MYFLLIYFEVMNHDEYMENKSFWSDTRLAGILLFICALLSIVIANSPMATGFHHVLETSFGVSLGTLQVSKSIHHWINDGLMAIFFFVVGLELKREIIAGELSDSRKAMLPIAAAVGGMVVPALIYLLFNSNGDGHAGWGIPMATDIAFALGVLHLLGKRVPLSLKVFLTALAVADDIGAVLVIAFFYTSEINFMSLGVAGVILSLMILANRLGVRNTSFYAVFSICGLWLSFLMSGVHPTIAAVLAAFTIPANVKLPEADYLEKTDQLMSKFRAALPNGKPTVTDEQLHILEDIRTATKHALTPLQRLEHMLHPFVSLLIMPVFALCNAGFVIGEGFLDGLLHPVSIGAFLGLVLGKFIGVSGTVFLFYRMRWSPLPTGMRMRHVMGAGLLAGIGFTMSLFVAGLAFPEGPLMEKAKIGIVCASVVAGVAGYVLLSKADASGKAE